MARHPDGMANLHTLILEFAASGEEFGLPEAFAYVHERRPEIREISIRSEIQSAAYYGTLERVSKGRYRLARREQGHDG